MIGQRPFGNGGALVESAQVSKWGNLFRHSYPRYSIWTLVFVVPFTRGPATFSFRLVVHK